MKPLKYAALAVLCAGLTSFASASITLVGEFTSGGPGADLHDQNPETVLAFFQGQTGMNDATPCIDRVEDSTVSGGFTITFSGDQPGGETATISFDLTGTEQVLCGIWVFGGGSGNLYTIAADQGTTGEFVVNAPENPSGNFAGISHIDLFCCPGGVVPDSGTTAMLLGSALASIGLLRRYLKR